MLFRSDISAGGENAVEVSFSFSNSVRVRFAYDEKSGEYKRFVQGNPHNVEGAGDGKQLSFTNVLIQKVGINAGSYTDGAGNRTQETDVVGQGEAILVRGGKAFRGTWNRSSTEAFARFTASDGTQLDLAPGSTIIELVPGGRQITLS